MSQAFPCFIVLVACISMVQAAPEQVHLALCKEPDCMSVSWVTMHDEGGQKIVYGRDVNASNHESPAKTVKWTFKGITRYMHNVKISNLRYDSKYHYYVGNGKSNSKKFFFTTFPKGDNFLFKVGLVGDLGIAGKSIPYMIEATQKRWIHMVVHVGDIAYNLQNRQGKLGDAYMRKIEPIAAYIPYMVIAGNHEEDGEDFANLRYRFSMPDSVSGDNQYYSFNVGQVHWVGLSSELYAYAHKYGKGRVQNQY
ncbi:unnamed protein product [Bursaphelenchus xylophilus]|uniref:Purple acid phosphatase n=1 Tax=Bursaphelenchus xylophilus TaxID=6326 RepID=A0A1I7RMC0_BURXY|nr:unnamed protein product [Bursaphelenchus xylophilus]CAG9118365.1 unnamed protein product [Bursaphelenchus xylophilus]